MKRILIFVVTVLVLMSFAGCGKEEIPQAYFTAEVLEVHETNMLVMATDKGNSGVTVGSEAYVTKNVTSEDGCPELYVGDLIKVYFNGEVMETYPLQLGKVYSVEIVEKANTPDWGVKLTAENVTAKGLTIVCEQSGGNPSGELMTGSYYVIESFDGTAWSKVDYKNYGESEIGWDDIAYIIPLNDSVKWDVDWSWLYGELPEGQYRIGKEIMDFKGTGNYDKAMFYACFDIIQYCIASEDLKEFFYKEDTEKYGDSGLARHDGFVNTSAIEINDMQTAIERAKAECTVYYDVVSVSYDAAEGVWRVDFGQSDALGGGESIYLSSDGITLMAVLGE